jgi:hypothetical protein
MNLAERVLLEVQRRPGVRSREIASLLGASRKNTNRVLYGELKQFVRKDSAHRWWPQGYSVQENLSEAHALLINSLRSEISTAPRTNLAERPLDLELGPPHLVKGRFYLFPLKRPGAGGGRAYINITLGGTSNGGFFRFDRTGGYKPFLVGYDLDFEVFILFDAEVYELEDGIKYNRFCYVDSDLRLVALRHGVSTEVRLLRKPPSEETVVACRASFLSQGLEVRRTQTLERLLST